MIIYKQFWESIYFKKLIKFTLDVHILTLLRQKNKILDHYNAQKC